MVAGRGKADSPAAKTQKSLKPRRRLGRAPVAFCSLIYFMRGWLTAVLLLLHGAAASPIPGEACGASPASPLGACDAPLDIAIVIDNSLSTSDSAHTSITSALTYAIGHDLALSAAASSPRVMIVSYDEPSGRPCAAAAGCSPDGAAEILAPLTANAATLAAALAARPAARGLACISCGLSYARTQLAAARGPGSASRVPLIVLVTEGSQTTAGTDARAVDTAESIRADGYLVVAISLGGAPAGLAASIATPAYALVRQPYFPMHPFFHAPPVLTPRCCLSRTRRTSAGRRCCAASPRRSVRWSTSHARRWRRCAPSAPRVGTSWASACMAVDSSTATTHLSCAASLTARHTTRSSAPTR